LAKEDHIYRLNHVLNSLFRFNLHRFDLRQLWETVALANFLFLQIGLDRLAPSHALPAHQHPSLYAVLIQALHAPRPVKHKPSCSNCNSKQASRRQLCVACYRYQLKHNVSRPLRLIVANRQGQPTSPTANAPTPLDNKEHGAKRRKGYPSLAPLRLPRFEKSCANCGIQDTHQWYRNLCGQGHWCETCKSYYLRHNKARPSELFVKAAKRKVDIRSLMGW
ncbi:hypothetical protein DM01DRAFT_1273312, partial [Hesseltinella vesiculosa]